jgi:hypothetical protein
VWSSFWTDFDFDDRIWEGQAPQTAIE